eukprot:TRINITY_DN5224_c0_g1_i3.p1 TRINITY_DN5224_c0_g1~~TRINITY_DN5224_c0_g1_i3.p1  ORF type:complete len:272 (-),score=76.27 TRINITY_DN5224_c0_g1_i3:65-880(-)
MDNFCEFLLIILQKNGMINAKKGGEAKEEDKCVFYEVDYGQVVSKKINAIKRNKTLLSIINGSEENNENAKKESTENGEGRKETVMDRSFLHSEHYHIVSVDLNQVSKLEEALIECGIDKDAPTLFISECVLIYLKAELSDKIISWVSKDFPVSAFVTYEQIKPDDAFGRVMMDNLVKRGCPLLGASAYPTLQSQIDRYRNLGFQNSEGFDMLYVYDHLLDQKELQRIQKIEPFDEYEEWGLIQSHYSLLWAWQDKQNASFWKKSLSTINT